VSLTSEFPDAGSLPRSSRRSVATGHRLWDVRTGGPPVPTRRMPPWIWPLEIAARWRARLEGRYG